MVVQHATAHLDAPFLWVGPYDTWWFYDGVPAFFIISGYFVYRSVLSFERRGLSTGSYLINRALRVAPAIWCYLAISVVVLLVVGVITFSDLTTAPGLAWIATTLMLAPVYSPGFLDDFGVGVINGSLWTIPVEVSFYVALPLLLVVSRRNRRALGIIVTCAAVAAVVAAVALGESLPGKLLGVTFLPHLGFFALGMGWYHLWPRWRSRGWHLVLAALGYVLAVTARNVVSDDWHLPLTLLAATPLSLLLMIAGHHGPQWCSAVTRRLGDLSFGTYIWHMPIINLMLWMGFTRDLPHSVAPFLALLVTLAVAWCSWRLIERPALDLKRHTSRSDRTTKDQAVAG